MGHYEESGLVWVRTAVWQLAERLPRGWTWVVPLVIVVLMFAYERRWFL